MIHQGIECWPHQVRAIDGVVEAVNAGEKRVLLTIPTGGGKSLVACEPGATGLPVRFYKD